MSAQNNYYGTYTSLQFLPTVIQSICSYYDCSALSWIQRKQKLSGATGMVIASGGLQN